MRRPVLTALFLLAMVATGTSAAGWASGGSDALSPAGHPAEWEVRWVERRAEKTYDGELLEGGQRGYLLDLQQDNLTRIDLVLSWVETHDDLGASRDDTFRLEATMADGALLAGSPARGAGGVLVLRSGQLNPIPEGGAMSEAEADRLRGEIGGAGQGIWRATVTLEDTGNAGGQRLDRGNAYILTVVLRYYEATFLRSVSLEPPRALSPGGIPPGAWEWATYGLGGASLLLGGLLVADRRRKS